MPASNPAARLFDGVDDVASVATSPVLAFAGDFTVEAWLRDDHADYAHPGAYVLAHGGQGQTWAWWLAVRSRNLELGVVNAGAEATAAVCLDATVALGGPTAPDKGYPALAPSAWHHAAATYRHSDRQVRLYVDGALWKTATLALAVAHASITTPLAMGRHPASGQPWLGALDEVRLWSRLRTDAEVRAYARVRAAATETGLVACYHNDDPASASSLVESTANGLHLSVAGPTRYTASVPVLYAPGEALPPADYGPNPQTLFGVTTPGGSFDNGGPIELGLKFRTEVAGLATGVRFYKFAADTGPHTGSLWTADGTLLAATAFAGETAEGWQEALFATPVPLTEYTTYVVSRFSPTGVFAYANAYFNDAGHADPPLYAFQNGELFAPGANGVFRSGASGFPTDDFGGTNYWVDVLFEAPPIGTTYSDPNRGLAGAATVAGAGAAVRRELNRPVAALAAVALKVGNLELLRPLALSAAVASLPRQALLKDLARRAAATATPAAVAGQRFVEAARPVGAFGQVGVPPTAPRSPWRAPPADLTFAELGHWQKGPGTYLPLNGVTERTYLRLRERGAFDHLSTRLIPFGRLREDRGGDAANDRHAELMRADRYRDGGPNRLSELDDDDIVGELPPGPVERPPTTRLGIPLREWYADPREWLPRNR
jgi:hypothetical protein